MLAERFCDAVKPHMASVLTEWARSGQAESLEARSSELLQAWGTTRTFEKRLMSSLEGIVSAGSAKGDRSYEDLKLRAAGHLRDRQAQQVPDGSIFDVSCHRTRRFCAKRLCIAYTILECILKSLRL
jgi:hypothetical protein